MRAAHLMLTGLSLLLTGCDFDFEDMGPSDAHKDPFHYNYDFKPGGRLTIDNYNGSIEIEGWEQPKIEISGARFASSMDLLREVKVEVQARPDAVSIRTVRPAERHGGSGARYVIRMPRQAVLELVKSTNGAIRIHSIDGPATVRTTNGSLRLASMNGQISSSTTNGSVEVTDSSGTITVRSTNGRIKLEGIRGSMDASTTNGGIFSELLRSEGDRPMRLATTNGSVEVLLPSGLKQDVRASTTNGSITVRMPENISAQVSARTSGASVHSEFPVTGEIGKKRIEGRIGAGGPLLDLSTSNGTINLQRGS